MIRLIRYLLILAAGFLGASYTVSPAAPVPNRVVTKIQVTIMHDGETSEQIYTDNDSMESILTYLRLTDATVVTAIAPKPTISDTLPPYISLVSMSMPLRSVPSQWALLG